MAFVLFASFVLCVAHLSTASPVSVPTKILLNSANQFSTDLYKNIARYEEGNLAICPLSAHHALGMAVIGAAGNSEQVLSKSLYLPKDKNVVQRGFVGETSFLHYVGNNVQLLVANKIYTSANINLKQKFQSIIGKTFRSKCEKINFKDRLNTARIMNAWIARQTGNKIKKMVNADDIDDETTLIIVSTVYLKGEWLMPFESKLIKSRPFYVDAQTTKDVPTMFRDGDFFHGYIESLNAQYVVLPYKDPRMTMTIVIPRKGADLAYIEQHIEGLSHQEILNNGQSTWVDLYLPKFTLESNSDLIPPLSEMGSGEIFGDSANFSGIANEKLTLSVVSHKVIIEVNEKGTAASGSTSMSTGLKSLPTIIEVDRPSLLIIRLDDVNLFIGRLHDPTA